MKAGTIRFFMFISRFPVRWFGYSLATLGGWIYALAAPRRRRMVESNLEPVLGTSSRLRRFQVALQIFGCLARAYYELFFINSLSKEKLVNMVHLDEPGWSQMQEWLARGTGLVLAATHQSSFDLVGQVLVALGLKMFVLAMPDEAQTFQIFNQLRQQSGAVIEQVGPKALRGALRMLRSGGLIVTAGDRRIKGQGIVVEFFGRPTLLPDGPVRLALHGEGPIIGTFCRKEKGKYHVRFEPMELVRTGDDEADVRENVQRFARLMEVAIRAHPEQWHLFLRLWE